MNDNFGIHILADYYKCDTSILDDIELLKEIMLSAAKVSKMTIIKSEFHKFMPHGISGMVIVAESHLSIHTWPEYGFASVDVYTCGSGEPKNGILHIQDELCSEKVTIKQLLRGSKKAC